MNVKRTKNHAGIHPVQNPPYSVFKVERNGKTVRPFWHRDSDGKYWCGWTGHFTKSEIIAMCRTTLEDLENDPSSATADQTR